MLYKCYKQVICLWDIQSSISNLSIRFRCGIDQAKFYIPDSYGFKSFEIVRDELQLLLIRFFVTHYLLQLYLSCDETIEETLGENNNQIYSNPSNWCQQVVTVKGKQKELVLPPL